MRILGRNAMLDNSTLFVYPGDDGAKLMPKSRYGNYIGGEWISPKDGKYFENTSPTSGKVICEIPRSNSKDVEIALDAAHMAAPAWVKLAQPFGPTYY
mgnify:CR=1 FL=1